MINLGGLIALLTLLSFQASFVFAQQTEFVPDSVLEKELDTALRALKHSPADIEAERKSHLVAYLKRKSVESPGISQSGILYDLIRLRDEGTIRSFAGKEIPPEIRDRLYTSRSPIAIEVLAPLVMQDEGELPNYDGDTAYIPLSFEVASNIPFYLFAGTAGLSPELNRWGQHFVAVSPFDRVLTRKIMREWWQENAIHFQTRNYAAAKAPNYALPAVPPPVYATVGRTPATPSPPQETATTIGTLQPASSNPPSVFNPTPWVIGALLLMLGGLCWWARNEPRS